MTLSAADEMLIQIRIDQGYIDFETKEYRDHMFVLSVRNGDIVPIRTDYGDGASKCFINYMERQNEVPLKVWGRYPKA